MRASLDIRLRRGRNGAVDASGELAASPLWCRWDGSTLWVVGSAASPVGDDHVRIRLEVGPGVTATVRTVAAMVLYTAHDCGTSTVNELEVHDGARLHWAPEPVIITGLANHRAVTTVELAGTASAQIDETVVMGRHADERSGRLVSRTVVSVDGTPTLRTSFDTASPGWHGPGGIDGASVSATRIQVPGHVGGPDDGHGMGGQSPGPASQDPLRRSTLMRSDAGTLMAVALGDDPSTCRTDLDRLLPPTAKSASVSVR